jgi:hypothetical protein
MSSSSSNFNPTATGLDLGSTDKRWDLFAQNVDISGTATVTGSQTVGGNLSVTGNETVGGTLGVTGAATLSSTLAVTGALTLQSNAIAATANRFLPKQAMVRVTKSAAQSINSGSATALTWDTETFDTDSLHDNVTNNNRLTASVTGKWMVTAAVSFAANSTGYRQVKINKNNTTDYAIAVSLNLGASDTPGVTVSDIVDLAAGDYVQIIAAQNSGGALNVITAGTTASMYLIGV